ncbi:MAG TPA: HutD family protein [Rhizobiaceae bacterium]|nr:HutD family protein [Rhizobiaceae bacterium]
MRILRAADHRVMPWKNGGGTTTEIAVYPEGAGLDTFEWRVSMARVETNGPFSAFPGVERTLAVLDGEGIRLEIEGQKPIELTKRSKPLGFPADVKTSAELLGGAITDLNVMTRRGTWKHTVERVALRERTRIELFSGATLVLASEGGASVAHSDTSTELLARDCALFDASDEPAVLEPHGTSALFLLRLSRAR